MAALDVREKRWMSSEMLRTAPSVAALVRCQTIRDGRVMMPKSLTLFTQQPVQSVHRFLSFRANPKHAQPLDTKRILETKVVENAGNPFMRWVGRGSAMQMYCTIVFAGKLIFDADPAANIYEVWAASGALASASACVFFGAKILCDKIVTDVASCRNFGEKDEFVRLTIQGALDKYALHVSLEDIQLVAHDAPDTYRFKVGDRNFTLDLKNGRCTNQKTLENLLSGKPLVSRKAAPSKQKK